MLFKLSELDIPISTDTTNTSILFDCDFGIGQ